MLKKCLVALMCFFFFVVGCDSSTVYYVEKSTKVEADTFQVDLYANFQGLSLPSTLIYFADESPRTAAKMRGTDPVSVEDVIVTRFPKNKYRVVSVVRVGNTYRATISKTSEPLPIKNCNS
jgi:hypothetical protein